MKTGITDKLLWDMYELLGPARLTVDFLLHPPRSMKSITEPQYAFWGEYRKSLSARQFYSLIYYLKKKGYIRAKSLAGKETIMLTKRGISRALMASFKMENEKKRKDGKWIMLIFDLPKKKNNSRKLLRSVLLNLGYKMFQQSVWVCPYNILEKTEKALQYHQFDQYIKIFLVEKLWD